MNALASVGWPAAASPGVGPSSRSSGATSFQATSFQSPLTQANVAVVRCQIACGSVPSRSPTTATVQIVLSTFLTAQTINLPMLFMGAAVGALPLVIVFLVMQRYIVQGVRLGRLAIDPVLVTRGEPFQSGQDLGVRIFAQPQHGQRRAVDLRVGVGEQHFHAGYEIAPDLSCSGLIDGVGHAACTQESAGEASGVGENHLNLIHRDDAVSAIFACFSAAPTIANEIFNVTDDAPAPKAEVASWIAARLGLPTPRFTGAPWPGRRSVTPDRCIANAKLKRRLGWQPRYPTFRDGCRLILGPFTVGKRE